MNKTDQNIVRNLFAMSEDEAREFVFDAEVREMEREQNAFVENEAIVFFKNLPITCEFCSKLVSKEDYTYHILLRHPEEQ